MVDKNVILIRISKLKEYLDILKDISNYNKDEYTKTPVIYGAAERFLHLSIECVIDMGNHMISDLNYRKPESNRDTFEVLYENEIIDVRLKEDLGNMAGFRNILVHDYLRLDRTIVYEIIQNNLSDIELFIKTIVDYI